jgi:hypothetical protein
VQKGASVLDVGGSESTVGLSLASLGYRVTTVDPRPSPLSHPQLRQVASTIEDWEEEERFDASILVSTIEHIGIGAYGLPASEDADLTAMSRVRDLTKDEGLLVLTTPYGRSAVEEHQRIYDNDRLQSLLEGWRVEDFAVLRRTDPTTWVLEEDTSLPTDGSRVALVTARRSF